MHALLPLKDLSVAKTRLAGVLSNSERHALAMAMAEDVLAALSAHPAIESVTVLSDDPAAHLLAAAYTAQHLPEARLGCRGLNAVVAAAVGRLVEAGAGELLVLHGDLPLLRKPDLDEVARRLPGSDLLIGADRAGTGTNLLAFGAARVPAFRFGDNSCARHLDWAREANAVARVLRSPGVELDVDQPSDLQQLLQLEPGGHTGGLLRQWPRQRLQLALQSLAEVADPPPSRIGKPL